MILWVFAVKRFVERVQRKKQGFQGADSGATRAMALAIDKGRVLANAGQYNEAIELLTAENRKERRRDSGSRCSRIGLSEQRNQGLVRAIPSGHHQQTRCEAFQGRNDDRRFTASIVRPS